MQFDDPDLDRACVAFDFQVFHLILPNLVILPYAILAVLWYIP
jgi:hypothetical protein